MLIPSPLDTSIPYAAEQTLLGNENNCGEQIVFILNGELSIQCSSAGNSRGEAAGLHDCPNPAQSCM